MGEGRCVRPMWERRGITQILPECLSEECATRPGRRPGRPRPGGSAYGASLPLTVPPSGLPANWAACRRA